MRFLIAGSSGFLGTRLREHLAAEGHSLTSLVRRPAARPGEAEWDPYAGRLDPALVEAADVVVNLAGSPTFGNPHSAKWARTLADSRITTTRVLAEAIAAASTKPVFLAGNGVSYYGDHGSEPLTESADSRGDALLTRVTREWQSAADPAVAAGARVCILRTTPVLDRRSEPLHLLTLLFRLGLGGPLGDGEQYFPVISTRDWVGAVTHLATDETLHGPVNLVMPHVPTNAEFTKALAAAVHRPAFLRVPAPVIRVAGGRMAPEVLSSMRAVPQKLLDAGFSFADRDITAVLATGMTS